MNPRTDQELLRDYAERRSEAAFAELVRRHIDLVYSAAQRMVSNSHQAEDVSQSVFIALAQNAGQLAQHPVLSGWLHRTTQNLAANAVRATVRRQVREQEAAGMNELLSTAPGASWETIAPHLDAALGELSEPDRDALLLRYFERKSAREMAETLGISDEAAQKRVTRAVERLREFFFKRGITVGAGGLVMLISANAVQSAPATLAVHIAAQALSATATATISAVAATKIIAMTSLQKTLIGATLAAAAGTAMFEAHQATQLRDEIRVLREQQSPLTTQARQLQDERDQAVGTIASLNDELASNKTQNAELLRLRGEVALLRRETEELRKTNRPPPAMSTVGTGMSYRDLRFQGYETPVAAFQSALAARLQGDRAAFLASLTPAERQREEERIRRLPPDLRKTQAEFEADEAAQISNALPKMVEMRVVEERVDSADRVTLRVRSLHRKNSDEGSWMDKELNFQKIGNEWKLDDGL